MIPKLHYQDSQEELIRAAGQMTSLIESDRHIKSAASNAMSREMLADCKPDKDHALIHLIAMGDYEHYGCFFAGTPVLTSEGFKNIEDVKVGDWALTHNNRYRLVTETFAKPYSGGAVRIRCKGLPDSEAATTNHPYRIVRAKDFNTRKRCPSHAKRANPNFNKSEAINAIVEKAEYVRADSIRKGDFMIIPIGVTPCYSVPLPEDLAEFAGFYLAEGCVFDETRELSSKGKPKGLVFVVHSENDKERIQDVVAYQSDYGYKVGHHPSASSASAERLELSNKAVAELMVKLFGRHSTKKFIHPELFSQTDSWKLRFLAAYFDGDGHLHTNASHSRYENTLTASTASVNLAHDLQRLLASVGVPSSVNKSYNLKKNGCFGKSDHVIYSVSVGGSHSGKITEFCKRIKPVNHYARKHSSSNVHISDRYILVPVKVVETFEVRDVVKYNIEVDGDHTFVTKTLSHNSNRNGDAWPKAACEQYHPTFVSHGHMFREHKNRDAATQGIGAIKASCYNADLGRIELAVWAHKKKAADVIEKIASGLPTSYSMSARVPYDRSSITGRLAKNPSEYDEYTKYRMNQYIPEFKKYAFVYNDKPTFFDISYVQNPADRIAHYLEYQMDKAASATVQNGYDLAVEAGVFLPDATGCADTVKQALVVKLVELENYLDAVGQGMATRDARYQFCKHAGANAFRGELTEEQVKGFLSIDPGTLFNKLARRQTVLPFLSFVAYATGRTLKEAAADPRVAAARSQLGHVFRKLAATPCCDFENLFDPSSNFMSSADLKCSDEIDRMLDEAGEKFSHETGTVGRRSIEIAVSGEKSASVSPVNGYEEDADILLAMYGHYKVAALKAVAAVHGSDSTDINSLLTVIQNRIT